jgi:hypothetical protein
MMRIAQACLPKKTKYHKIFFDEAIDLLDYQDAFIFQRSLYAFYDNLAEYRNLAKKVYSKLNKRGFVFVYEILSKYDIPVMKEYIYSKVIGSDKEKVFNANWKIFEKVLLNFNTNVDSGRFIIFSRNNLIDIFNSAGFKLKVQKDAYFIFRK